MPETTGTTSNGSVVALATPEPDTDRDRYRPKASTTAVHDRVMTALAGVVDSAVHNAGEFVHLADYYDRDATTAVRLGHLVDACECMEIAMTHLGQLKAAMAHRLHVEDAQNLGDSPF